MMRLSADDIRMDGPSVSFRCNRETYYGILSCLKPKCVYRTTWVCGLAGNMKRRPPRVHKHSRPRPETTSMKLNRWASQIMMWPICKCTKVALSAFEIGPEIAVMTGHIVRRAKSSHIQIPHRNAMAVIQAYWYPYHSRFLPLLNNPPNCPKPVHAHRETQIQ